MVLAGGKLSLARSAYGLRWGGVLLQRLADDEDVLQVAKQVSPGRMEGARSVIYWPPSAAEADNLRDTQIELDGILREGNPSWCHLCWCR